MKIVKPSIELIEEKDPFKKIELVARTCYKSEEYITDTSAKRMVKSLISKEHTAMIEHACFVFVISKEVYSTLFKYLQLKRFPCDYPIHMTHSRSRNRYLVSGNLRALLNLNFPDLNYALYQFDPDIVAFHKEGIEPYKEPLAPSEVVLLSDIEELKNLSVREYLAHKYYSIKFICDRGVSHEFVRHRLFSFAQESTRYCNYSRGKWNEECTFIEPIFFKDNHNVLVEWKSAMKLCERAYMDLIEFGARPEEARSVLPNSLKTELVMTGNASMWENFFKLRYLGSTGKPHPQAFEVAKMAREIIKTPLEQVRNIKKNRGE